MPTQAMDGRNGGPEKSVMERLEALAKVRCCWLISYFVAIDANYRLVLVRTWMVRYVRHTLSDRCWLPHDSRKSWHKKEEESTTCCSRHRLSKIRPKEVGDASFNRGAPGCGIVARVTQNCCSFSAPLQVVRFPGCVGDNTSVVSAVRRP